ncbi:hypothetical protein BDV06DRAFT_208224, partial [Aspergillus oleicola]
SPTKFIASLALKTPSFPCTVSSALVRPASSSNSPTKFIASLALKTPSFPCTVSSVLVRPASMSNRPTNFITSLAEVVSVRGNPCPAAIY